MPSQSFLGHSQPLSLLSVPVPFVSKYGFTPLKAVPLKPAPLQLAGKVSGNSRKFLARIAAYSAALRRRSALEITETELRLMAALAIIGFSSNPTNG